MKNILFKISKLVSVFFLLLFSFFLILTTLVSFKPIKINNLKALENVQILEDFQVKEFGNIFLSFNKYSRNYEIFIEDIRTNSSLIPNILLGIKLKDILFLKFKPTILKLYDAELDLNFKKKNNKQFIQPDNLLNFFVKNINNTEYSNYINDFQIFEVNNSKLKIQLSENENYMFSRIDLKIEKKKNDFVMSALLEQNEKTKSFAGLNTIKLNNKYEINFTFENFNLTIPRKYLKKFNIAESIINLNGTYSLKLDSNENKFKNISKLTFNSQITKKFKEKIQKINFSRGKIYINFDNDFITLNLNFLETNSKVKISYSFAYKDFRNQYFKISMSEMTLKKLKIFWPEFYETSVKEWIYENASGNINELNLKVNYDKKGLIENYLLKFNFSNTNIRYSEDKPLVKDLEGNASFDGEEFKFNIFSGVSDKLVLNNATVKLYDFDQEKEMADIQLEITGNNYNLITYLEKISFNSESKNKLSKFNGSPVLKLNLKFPLLIDLKFDDIVYEGQLIYNSAKIPNFVQNYNLENVNIKIDIIRDTFDYIGDANFQKMNIKFSGTEYLNETFDFQNNLNINIDFNPSILNDYFPDFVKHNIGFIPLSIIYHYNLKNDNYEIIGEGQMDKLSSFFTFFNLKHHFFQGNLNFKLSGKKNMNEKLKLRINTEDLNLFVESRKYNNQLNEIILHSIKSPSQDFHAKIVKKKNFWKADFSGSNLNLVKVLEDSKAVENFSTPVKFNITTNSLVLKKKEIFINSFSGKLDNSRFSELDINFNTSKSKNNNIRIYNENGNKKLSIASNDASEFLNVFGINPNIKSGTLTVEANQDKNKNYIGNIKIEDFVAYDTPFFAKVLTLFSLDGIEQKLKDGGIFFNRLNSNYHFSDGDIKFSDGIIRGSDLGLTFQGDFDSKTDNFEANGTFIPAYTINTLLTSLPVVGNIITAGSPEDGILAASFKLKKENEKFDINFNPISVLVPSLIRNLFKNQ